MAYPTRVDVASDRDHELASEFDPESSLADTSPENQFRRAERRIAVRRGALPKKTASRIRVALIAVQIQERTPVAYAQINNRIELVDGGGVIMELPRKTHYSFPVVLGLNDSDPISRRAAQMKLYSRLISELDAGGTHYSNDLSEVGLDDPDDVKATVADPAGAVLVHLGNDQFLERFRIYLSHVGGWRQQFQSLESVDLRYEGQIIVNPDDNGTAPKMKQSRKR